MENIESKINNKINEIKPPRSLFESTMNSVTKEDIVRNKIMKDEIPSLKKSSYIIFTKRLAYISSPILALAVYLLLVNVNHESKLIVQGNNPVAITETQDSADARVISEVIDDATYIDSVITEIISDAEGDSSFAINDSDDNFINNELDDFNSNNLNLYEEII